MPASVPSAPSTPSWSWRRLCWLGFCIPLYNMPDAISHQLHQSIRQTLSRTLDVYAVYLVMAQTLLFVAYARHACEGDLARCVPRDCAAHAAWLVLANVANCAVISITCLYLYNGRALAWSVDLCCFVTRVALVLRGGHLLRREGLAWAPLLLLAGLVGLAHASPAQTATWWMAGCLSAATHAVDAFLDEYNARISATFASAQKNVVLLVLLYGLRVEYRHGGGAVAAWGDCAGALALTLLLVAWTCPTEPLALRGLEAPTHPETPPLRPAWYALLMSGWCARALPFLWPDACATPWILGAGLVLERLTSAGGSILQEHVRFLARQGTSAVAPSFLLDLLFKVPSTVLRLLPVLAWCGGAHVFFALWLALGLTCGMRACTYADERNLRVKLQLKQKK